MLLKVVFLGNNTAHFVWKKKGCMYDHNKTIFTVMYGVGSIAVWGCFSTNSTLTLPVYVTEGYTNGAMHQNITEEFNLISQETESEDKLF